MHAIELEMQERTQAEQRIGLSTCGHVLTAENFADFHRPELSAVIMPRQLPHRIQEISAKLAQHNIEIHKPVTFPKRDVPALLETALADIEPDMAAQKALLAQDMADVVQQFKDTIRCRTVQLTLCTTYQDAFHQDSTQDFHLDESAYQLTCTYHGPGTEWLPKPNARMVLELDDYQPIDPDGIEKTNAGDIVCFKTYALGSNQQHTNMLIHRAPPLEPGQRRLVMVLWPVS